MPKKFHILFLFPFLFFLSSCAPQSPTEKINHTSISHDPVYTIGNESADQAVQEYFQSQTDFSWQTEEESKNICVFDKLDQNELFPHYLWVHCSEFKLVDGKVRELSGSSIPAKIDYPNELSFFDPAKFTHEIPGSGTNYPTDIRKIFPDDIENLALSYDATAISEYIKQVAEADLTTAITE